MDLIICQSCLNCDFRQFEKRKDEVIYWDKEFKCDRHKVERYEQCIHFPICKRIEGESAIRAVD